ncbi:MAG: SDR family NAD(P)-dependent oxidoreductase, partial [Actinomycetes bacterium]
MRLSGRTALVTGAGRGIGAATAVRLAADGARVAVNDLDAPLAQLVVDEVVAVGGQALAVPADLLDVAAVDGMVATVVQTWGVPDVVVNNAGTTRDRMFHRMDPESFAFGVDANLTTAVNVTRAAVAVMREAAKVEIERSGAPDHVRKIV